MLIISIAPFSVRLGDTFCLIKISNFVFLNLNYVLTETKLHLEILYYLLIFDKILYDFHCTVTYLACEYYKLCYKYKTDAYFRFDDS